MFPKGQSRANSENRPESRSRRRPVRTRSGTRVARNASVGSRVARRHEGGRREASRARRRVGRAGQCFLPFTQRISSHLVEKTVVKTVSVFSNVRRTMTLSWLLFSESGDRSNVAGVSVDKSRVVGQTPL